MNDAATLANGIRTEMEEVLERVGLWESDLGRALAATIRFWAKDAETARDAALALEKYASDREHELEQALLKAEHERDETSLQRDDAVALLEELLPHLEYDAPASGYVTARPVPDALRWDALCMVDSKYEAWKPLEQERHD